MREIETLLRELKRYGNAGRDCALAAEDALAIAAALEAAREDAERYRWLRSLNGSCDAAACVNINIGFDWIEQHGAELDAAIDQARGKGGGEVEGG